MPLPVLEAHSVEYRQRFVDGRTSPWASSCIDVTALERVDYQALLSPLEDVVASRPSRRAPCFEPL